MSLTKIATALLFISVSTSASAGCDRCSSRTKEFRSFFAETQRAQSREDLRNKTQRFRFQISDESWVGVGGKGLKFRVAF